MDDLGGPCSASETNGTEQCQIVVRIIEAKQLVGNDIDPFVEVVVGQLVKTTKTKRATNDVIFDEDFVFDINLPKVVFLQHIISITAFADGGLFRSRKTIGTFKIDAATVHAQPGQGFYRKWAMLLDPEDPMSGSKGYVKCDIVITIPGSTGRVPRPTVSAVDEDDIEGNLLVPEEGSDFGERQPAKFIVTVFRGESLPTLNATIILSMKKALIGQAPKALVNPYVQVSFAGRTGKTRIVKHNANPEWNQEIVFVELFPALVKTIRIHVRDEAGAVLGTALLDLDIISESGSSSYLPTFGSSYINLYGDLRSNIETSRLNFGLGEGIAYRGRLCIAVRVELLEFCPRKDMHKVTVANCPPPTEEQLGDWQDLTLFASIYDATMIDKKYSNKSLHFEFSIGEFGYFDDSAAAATKALGKGVSKSVESLLNSERSSGLASSLSSSIWTLGSTSVAAGDGKSESTDHIFTNCERTDAKKSTPTKGDFCYVDYGLDKPCVSIAASYQYHFKRYADAAVMKKIYTRLDKAIKTIEKHLQLELNDRATEHLNNALSMIAAECTDAAAQLTDSSSATECIQTDLDRQKRRQRITTLERLARDCDRFKNQPCMQTVMHHLIEIKNRLKMLTYEVQEGLPDVFVWLCHHNKRVGYKRFRAADLLLLSQNTRANGSLLHTFFLNQPPTADGAIPGTAGLVTAYLWLSSSSNSSSMLRGVPDGYVLTNDPADHRVLHYDGCFEYQLRCYLFQGRSLVGSDDTGLSDPFVRIIFKEHVAQSQIVEQTISPVWDETLVLPTVYLPGSPMYFAEFPPKIILQVYDYDKVGKSEFLGQAEVYPIVKQSHDLYDGRRFPPLLQSWCLYRNANECVGDVLACFELIQVSPDMEPCPDLPAPINDKAIIPLPPYIKPILVPYILEVSFWGLRDLKPSGVLPIEEPNIEVECGGYSIRSSAAKGRKNTNFQCGKKRIKVLLPENPVFRPPLNIRCMDKKTFGRMVLIGTCAVPNIEKFMVKEGSEIPESVSNVENVCANTVEVPPKSEMETAKLESAKSKEETAVVYFVDETKQQKKRRKKNVKIKIQAVAKFMKHCQTAPLDSSKSEEMKIATMKIYPCELETVPEFGGFRDSFYPFTLVRGKKSTSELDEADRAVGKFKGLISIASSGLLAVDDSEEFAGTPANNESLRVLVRVYVIRARNLRPCDPSGKADPYLLLSCGKTKISDKQNRIYCQLNPIFGRMFEFEASFPEDYELTVSVFDWDRLTSDDLMGETKIDLEQRFYSKHRANCGLQSKYERRGYNVWRDCHRPTQILNKLCRQHGLTGPFYGTGSVTVGTKKFHVTEESSESESVGKSDNEALALHALRHWTDVPRVGYHLVPEHVETRTLCLPDKPGMEQPKSSKNFAFHGKLEMWVDILPLDGPPPPQSVEITPRKPTSYQLRVIVWDTKDVVLDDYNVLTGQSSVDQYVKSYLIGPKVDLQQTDIHYRSLNGEGNFNWRFLFNFDYSEAEERIVHKKKESTFSLTEHEEKLRPRINFQLWDADVITSDDYLVGAKSAKLCSIDTLRKKHSLMTTETSKVGEVNLFKAKRTRGWWPFVKFQGKEQVVTGKADIEILILSSTEVEARPAGAGRDPPDPMSPPQRPETSFAWFSSPLKMLKYDLWIGMRWRCLQILLILLAILFVALFIYQLPQSVAQKMVLG